MGPVLGDASACGVANRHGCGRNICLSLILLEISPLDQYHIVGASGCTERMYSALTIRRHLLNKQSALVEFHPQEAGPDVSVRYQDLSKVAE